MKIQCSLNAARTLVPGLLAENVRLTRLRLVYVRYRLLLARKFVRQSLKFSGFLGGALEPDTEGGALEPDTEGGALEPDARGVSGCLEGWNLRFIALVLSSVVFLTSSVSADLVVSIANLNLVTGQTGTLGVSISGTNNPVSIYGFELRITPLAGTTSSLRFLEENESYLSNPSCLFFGNSGALNDNVASSVGAVSPNALPSDTFIGLDVTANLANVNVSSSRLLAQIPIQHIFAPAAPETTVGHSFSISLVAPSGNSVAFLGGTSSTGLGDQGNAPIAYSSTSGPVTITAIPEPSQVLLLLPAAICGLCLRRHGWLRYESSLSNFRRL